MADFTFKESYSYYNTIGIQNSFDIYYQKIFGNDVEINRFDKNEKAQRNFGTDVVVTKPDGIRYSIDEKTRRENYLGVEFYPLETWSNKERGYRGWFYTLLANYICYATVNTDGKTRKATKILELLFFPLSERLRLWFEENYHSMREVRVSTNGLYHSHNKLIRIEDIKQQVNDSCFFYFKP